MATPTLKPISATLARWARRKVPDRHEETGLHRNMVTLLYQETATQIDIEAIDRLCRFFNVQVADLFETVPESDRRRET